MKKLCVLFCCITFIFSCSSIKAATIINENGIYLDDSEIQRLEGLGYTIEDMQELDVDEYNKYKGLSGEVIKVVTVYDKEQISNLNSLHIKNDSKSTYSDSIVNDGIYRGVLTVSKLSGYSTPTFKVMYDFHWTETPACTFTDVIDVGFSSGLTYVAGSSSGYYKYDRTQIVTNYLVETVKKSLSVDKKYPGTIGAKIDLIGSFLEDNTITHTNHRGRISVLLERAYDGTHGSANVFGHYQHQKMAGVFSISGGSEGGLSVSPALIMDEMKSAAADVSF